MKIPNADGQLILLLGSENLVSALLATGLTDTELLSVQIDGNAGGRSDGAPAPEGQAYCILDLADFTAPSLVSAALAVLDSLGPTAPARGAPTTVTAAPVPTRRQRPKTPRKGLK